MQLVCSPYLNAEDIEAIKTGYCDRTKIITTALEREIDKLEPGIMDDNLNLLTWLIKNDRLNIKIATVKNVGNEGLFHQKIGIFYDKNMDYVVFAGSNNETERAIAANYEQFDVYKSWNDLEDRCKDKLNNFDEIWNNQDPDLKILDFPDALKEKILERVKPQPKISKKDMVGESSPDSFQAAPRPKASQESFLNSLWWFQKDAIKGFFENNCIGLYSMATGTGKTRTAIGTMLELVRQKKRAFVVIVAPQNTILNQWESDVDSIDLKYKKVLAYNNTEWRNNLYDAVVNFRMNLSDCCIVYTTYATYHRDDFKEIIEKVSQYSLLICDEVHSSGAEQYQNGLLPAYKYRLGLSATPKRHFDDEGTDLLLKYFSKVVYEFSLKDALETENPANGKTFLCPYYYHPIFVRLTDDEQAEYADISAKIRKCLASKQRDSEGRIEDSYLDSLYLKRAKLLQNATNKLEEFSVLIDRIEPEFLIVFSSDKQIQEVNKILNNKNINHSQFTCEESFDERQNIIMRFERNECKVILAIMCLDEGVDIPRAERAILMASSTNPKQYIQRRGRLLRRHKDKEFAYIYDMIVLPAGKIAQNDHAILKKERERYMEFAGLAKNSTEAVNKLYDIYKEMGVI